MNQADITRAMEIVNQWEERALQPTVEAKEDPAVTFVAACVFLGVVSQRAGGNIEAMLAPTGLEHIAKFMRLGAAAAEARDRET